jgi:hypothetical protein
MWDLVNFISCGICVSHPDQDKGEQASIERNTEIASQSPKRELERLAQEMNKSSSVKKPAERQELRMFARTLISQPPSSPPETANGDTRIGQPMEIIAASLMLFLAGAGFFLILIIVAVGELLIFALAGAPWSVMVDLLQKKISQNTV